MNTDPYAVIAAFFALAFVFSWVLFIWLWAWNHKPRKSSSAKSRKPEKWLLPNNWRN
jgi:hypothetical protein